MFSFLNEASQWHIYYSSADLYVTVELTKCCIETSTKSLHTHNMISQSQHNNITVVYILQNFLSELHIYCECVPPEIKVNDVYAVTEFSRCHLSPLS